MPNAVVNTPAAEREAISLAPWLKPGGQVLQNDSLNRFQRFLLILLPTKTVRNFLLVQTIGA